MLPATRYPRLLLATALALPVAPAGAANLGDPPATATLEVPAGTVLEAELSYRLRSRDLESGERIDAELARDVTARGRLVARAGSPVTLMVSEVEKAGRVEGREELTLTAVALETADGDRVRLRTSSAHHVAEGSKKKDAATIGAGAGLGAVLGAITEGKKGAAVGAVAGGAAGGVLVLSTRGEAVELPAGTRLRFELERGVRMADLGPAPDAPPPPGPAPASGTRAPEARRVGGGRIEMPAGTPIEVRLVHALGSGELQSGDPFEAELAVDLVGAGRLVAPAGTPVHGRVTERTEGGRVEGRAGLTLELEAIAPARGAEVTVRTSAAHESARGTKKKDAATIGATTAAGALIGAVAEGKKGAMVGAVAGAAAGGVVVLSTRGESVKLPAGTALAFTLEQPAVFDDLGPAR